MTEADNLFTETFWSWASRFGAISSFRQICHLGLPTATVQLHDQCRQFADELFNDPKHDKLFIDKQKAYETIGGVAALGYKMLNGLVTDYNASVDAASLIFAHSIIDNAAFNYCRCCALANPSDWVKLIEKKKVSLEDIKGISTDEIFNRKVYEYISSLERESLLLKVDRLFQVCKPQPEFAPIHDYTYDRGRLSQLDAMRHDVVHKSSPIPTLPNGDKDIWFLQQTTLFLASLVNMKYNLKMDANYMLQKQRQ